MALPVVSIPDIPLPFNVPLEVHPCIVHLAVALPIVIVLIELVNLVAKKRALGVFSFVLMVLLALVLFGAYLTGSADAEHAKAALTGDAKSLFEAHKLQGVYLVYGAAFLVLIKLLSVLVRNTFMRIIFLLFLLAFTAMTINTAKKGKELVFTYGINVKAVAAPAAAASAAQTAPTVKTETMKSETPQEKSPVAEPAAGEKKPVSEAPVTTAAPKAEAAASEAKSSAAQMEEEGKETVKEEASKAQEPSEAASENTMETAPAESKAPETSAPVSQSAQ